MLHRWRDSDVQVDTWERHFVHRSTAISDMKQSNDRRERFAIQVLPLEL